VIYVGCVITLGFSYFFVTRHFRQQALMCGTFAALIGLTILAISELATPYQGAVVVSNQAFKVLAVSMGLPVHGGKSDDDNHP
jgi:cell division protein FtsX